jgi:tRNA threonylcarbamoyladenosine modification (KEOPS) complex  Pcc1 subunit
MTAGFHHFVIEQGATFSKTLTLKDSSDTLINLTGYAGGEMDLRTSNSRMALGGSAGTVTLTISASDTSGLDIQDGVYDLELTDGSSNIYRILEGTFQVRPQVSK